MLQALLADRFKLKAPPRHQGTEAVPKLKPSEPRERYGQTFDPFHAWHAAKQYYKSNDDGPGSLNLGLCGSPRH